MYRPIAILFLLAACALIALGRSHIRRARRLEGTPWRIRRKHTLGWTLLALGTLLMIAGVIVW